jgi:hypothetical protein
MLMLTPGIFGLVAFSQIKTIRVQPVMISVHLVTGIAGVSSDLVTLLINLVVANLSYTTMMFSDTATSLALILSGPLGLSTTRKLSTVKPK